MPATANKQPIFTINPIFRGGIIDKNSFGTFNPTEPNPNSSGAQSLFTTSAGAGTLIERVTITAAASPNSSYSTITAKLIYLIVYSWATGKSTIVKSVSWPSTTVTNTTPPISTEFVFDGGLLLEYDTNTSEGDALWLAVASGESIATDSGDSICWAIEGSTYDS